MGRRIVLEFTVQRGSYAGTISVPHKRRDRSFLVSRHKDGPHKQVWDEGELVSLVEQGWSVRMSLRDKSRQMGASLIAPSSLKR
jgi:hypothetical protein